MFSHLSHIKCNSYDNKLLEIQSSKFVLEVGHWPRGRHLFVRLSLDTTLMNGQSISWSIHSDDGRAIVPIHYDDII